MRYRRITVGGNGGKVHPRLVIHAAAEEGYVTNHHGQQADGHRPLDAEPGQRQWYQQHEKDFDRLSPVHEEGHQRETLALEELGADFYTCK